MSELATRIIPDGDKIHIARVQDVEPIIERNKALQSIEQRSDWGRHVAAVPCVILEKWLNEELAKGNVSLNFGSEEFNQIVWRKLQDPEWRNLRTDTVNSYLGFGS